MTTDIQTVVIESWEHALEVLYAESWSTKSKKFTSPFVFRGLESTNFNLLTSLQRLGANDPDLIPKLERHILRNFKKYAIRDVVSRDTDWHWLSVAQHHGLATRLLDWTYSPLVALHFATATTANMQVDGLIWMVETNKVRQEMPDKVIEQLQKGGSFTFFDVDQLTTSKLSPWELMDTPGQKSEDGFMVFLEPPSMDDRIINQYALFSTLSNPLISHQDWLECRPHLCRKVLLPADKKWEIRDKLDQANITERVLFPGLDGLSQWLNRYYYVR